MIKGAIEDRRIKVTEADGATLTVATAVFEVFDTASGSVQAEGNATITDNGTAEVILSGLVDSTDAGFVIDSDYEILFTYTIGSQTKFKRLDLHIGEEIGGAVSGNYITEDDVDNWPDGITDESKTEIIERVEAAVERLTKDIFYEVPFDIFKDGPGSDVMDLYLRGRILSVSTIYLLGVAMNSVNYSFTANSLHRDASGIASDDYLKYLERRNARLGGRGLFVEGVRNLEIVGTMGWPQKLAVDNLSGTFRAKETITGATNSYTAIVKRVTPTALWIAGKTGNFADDEEVEGATSGATADVNSASGAVDDPPNAIIQACRMLARHDNDPTLYTQYVAGSESIAGVTYSNKRKPLTGLREIDLILDRYVRKIPRMAVV